MTDDLRDRAEYIDTKPFVVWLLNIYGEEGLNERIRAADDARSGRWARRWYAWRNESRWVSVYTADEFLVRTLYLNLQDVPEHCFVERTWKQGKICPEDRLRAAKRVEAGETTTAIANELGISKSSVQKWCQRYRRGEQMAA